MPVQGALDTDLRASRASPWPLAILAVVGGVLFAASFDRPVWRQYLVAVIAAVVALIPGVNRILVRGLDYVRRATPKFGLAIGISIFFGSVAYFAASAIAAERPLIP